jgi:hypothetical protein
MLQKAFEDVSWHLHFAAAAVPVGQWHHTPSLIVSVKRFPLCLKYGLTGYVVTLMHSLPANGKGTAHLIQHSDGAFDL